jgi:hypothetical protein
LLYIVVICCHITCRDCLHYLKAFRRWIYNVPQRLIALIGGDAHLRRESDFPFCNSFYTGPTLIVGCISCGTKRLANLSLTSMHVFRLLDMNPDCMYFDS